MKSVENSNNNGRVFFMKEELLYNFNSTDFGYSTKNGYCDKVNELHEMIPNISKFPFQKLFASQEIVLFQPLPR